MMLNILTYAYFHLYVFFSEMSIQIFAHFNSIFFLIVVFQEFLEQKKKKKEFLVHFRCVCVCVCISSVSTAQFSLVAQFSSVQALSRV